MNKQTKPISSPGRSSSDKFPPPLMRFLRSNVGNKSRRRSRASPMFVKKHKNTLIEEPSSPKVTCIGQVRVTRSNKNNNKTTTAKHHPKNRLCRCLKSIKTTSFCNVWAKCVTFFRCGSCKDTPIIIKQQDKEQEQEEKQEEEQGQEDENETINEGLISRPMPKNAFLLTRCRSAPYKSCSLANVFRETITGDDVEDVEKEIKTIEVGKEDILKAVINDESNISTCNESNGGGGELKAVEGSPLILPRCKSEPAKTWDRVLV